MRRAATIVLLQLVLTGCGSQDDEDDSTVHTGATGGAGNTSAGGSDTGGVVGAGSGGTGADAAGGTAGCGAGTSAAWAYPLDLAAGCVLSLTPQSIGCAPHSDSGAYCAHRLADGAAFATTHAFGALDPTVWEPCSIEERIAALVSCELRGACGDSAATSFCSLSETQQLLGCANPTEVLDETCCVRPACTTSEQCDPGYECVQIRNLGGRLCRYESDGVCRCSGLPTGNLEWHCLPQ